MHERMTAIGTGKNRQELVGWSAFLSVPQMPSVELLSIQMVSSLFFASLMLCLSWQCHQAYVD